MIHGDAGEHRNLTTRCMDFRLNALQLEGGDLEDGQLMRGTSASSVGEQAASPDVATQEDVSTPERLQRRQR